MRARRWGSKVSQKLFVAKEYVLKHIRLKHAEKVDAQRERVRPLPYPNPILSQRAARAGAAPRQLRLILCHPGLGLPGSAANWGSLLTAQGTLV